MSNLIGKGLHTLYPQTQVIQAGHRLDESGPSKTAHRAEKSLKMALNLIKKVASEKGPGKTATEPSVSIAENGQVRLNTVATKALAGKKYLVLDHISDRDYRLIGLDGLPKGFTEADVIACKWTDGKGNAVNQLYFGFAGTLTQLEYDFKASGTQSFDAVVQEVKEGKLVLTAIAFRLPKGKLTPKAKTPRKARKAVDAAPPAPVVNGSSADDDDALGSLMQ